MKVSNWDDGTHYVTTWNGGSSTTLHYDAAWNLIA